MRIRAVYYAFILCLVISGFAYGTNYYVSPAGDNSLDGLTTGTAWLSIDNGDLTAVLSPGDTVNVLPGTYIVTDTIQLVTNGSAGLPIVYRKLGKGKAVLDANGQAITILGIKGNHVIVDGLEITNTTVEGVQMPSVSSTISNCYIHGCLSHGLLTLGDSLLIIRNVIADCGKDGIKMELGLTNMVYGNTVYNNAGQGIKTGKTAIARIFNNIVAHNSKKGIDAKGTSTAGFNNVWGNAGGDYMGGVVDSAGGITVPPGFVNPIAGHFDLLNSASEINAGLDLGYSFNQSAPDIGAFEKYNHYYVSTTGNDANSGLDTSNAWLSIDNGDSLLYPGDTVFVLSGVYADSVVITDNGLVDDMIVYKGVRDSTGLDGSGYYAPVRITATFVDWSGIDVSHATNSCIQIIGGNNKIRSSRIHGSSRYGINIISGAHNEVLKNVLDSNSFASVSFFADSTIVVNNTFYKGGKIAVDGQGTFDNLVSNNIFQAVNNGNVAVKADGTTELIYNVFSNFQNNTQGGVVTGVGCLFTDPLLVSADSGDFHLLTSSPAIDAGLDIGLPFIGVAPDMGAYESQNAVSITVVPVYDSLFADSAYQFSLQALDINGDPAWAEDIVWSHMAATGNISQSGIFSPLLVGSAKIVARSLSTGIVDTSGVMNVVPGSLSALNVTPARDTVSIDSTIQFSAAGSDIHGNSVTNVGVLTWEVTGGIGLVDNSGLFNPTTAGRGFIGVSSDLGPIGLSDTILVTAGSLAFIDVTPDGNTVESSSMNQYAAIGYDVDSNQVKNLTDSVNWSITDLTGSITAGGLYTAGTTQSPPAYYVRASYGGFEDSGSVTVISNGTLNYVQIELLNGTLIGDTTWTTDNDTTTVYARGYDVGNVLLGDVSVTWSLSGVDSIGSLSASSGTNTALILSKLGTGRITAVYSAGIADSTGVITCVVGAPVSLVVLPDTATLSANSVLQFSATSYDADGFPSNPGVVVGWTVLGGVGTISIGGLFSPTMVGTGNIVVAGSGLADTTRLITVTAGPLDHIAVSPDSVVISADSSLQFEALGYDAEGNLADVGTISWNLIGTPGSLGALGLFDATTVGSGRIVATSSLGPVDTSAYLGVTAGRLASLTISPDSIEIMADSSAAFAVAGVDLDGNSAPLGGLNWKVLGNIGIINSSGVFSAALIGTGRVVVTSTIDAVTDTNTVVVVTAGVLNRLVIFPDTATLRIGDTTAFTAAGYDAFLNPTGTGKLTWSVVGGIGTIDSTGIFVASTSGNGAVSVISNLGGVTDATGGISVEALTVSSIPLGTSSEFPGSKNISVLALKVDNTFANANTIIGIVLREYFRGAGSPVELLSNADSLSLFLDLDNNSAFSLGDSLISKDDFSSSLVTFNFNPISVPPGTSRQLFGCIDISLLAHDSDSLDLFMLPVSDLMTGNNGDAAGPDTVNSTGFGVIDGLVAGQVALVPSGQTAVTPGDSIYLVTAFDLPRNGYKSDTLDMLHVRNFGTATASDFDSIMLFIDDGDNLWEGPGVETMINRLVFTGSLWMRSGMNVVLSNPVTRFYIGVNLSAYPVNGNTLAFGFPTNGFSMASANDGPLDSALQPVDTLTIQTSEAVKVQALPIGPKDLVPGKTTGPLLSVEIVNSYGFSASLDSLLVKMLLGDPGGATQSELDSQIDSLSLWLDRDSDIETIGPLDSLLSIGIVSNGAVIFPTSGLSIQGSGGMARLTVSAWLSSTRARDGNSVNLSIPGGGDFFFQQVVSVTGILPLQNSSDFYINGFSSASIVVNSVVGQTIFGGQTDQVVLDLLLPGNGYAADELRSITLINDGSLVETDALTAMTLWSDTSGNGYSADDLQLGRFIYRQGVWELNGLAVPVTESGTRLILTVDIGAGQFQAGTLKMQLVVGGAMYRSGMTGPDDLPVGNPNEHVVFPSDRVTAISIPLSPVSVYPGSVNNDLLTFALYNGYTSQDKVLQAVTLTNTSLTLSGADFSDFEVGQIALYFDADGSRTFNGDTLVAVGRLAGGRLLLSGLNITLLSEQLSYFFVVCNIPTRVIDSDSLAVMIAAPSDFVFALDQSGAVNLNGDMPLTRGSYLAIDGSVRDQYRTVSLVPATVSPGDSNLTLLAFRPAANGDRQDTLESITIVNTLNADSSDLANPELWLDLNGDSTWQVSDSLVGTLAYNGSGWTLGSISLLVDNLPPLLMIVGDIRDSATAGEILRLSIPLNGCTYRSGNDGPLDLPVLSPGEFVISTAGLQITYTPLGSSFSVGQKLELRFMATNISNVTMDSVYGFALIDPADTSKVRLDSASSGSYSMLPSQSQEFVFYYTARSSGTLAWKLLAVNQVSLPDSSAIVSTTPITIQNAPFGALVQLVNSIPASVTKGQLNVFPLSFSLTHPDTAASTAALRLDSLTLRVDDGFGNDLLADSVFSRLVLANGYTNLSIIQTVPNSAAITLSFSSSVIILPGETQSLLLLIDIDSLATASNFALSIAGASGVILVDENSSLAVPLDSGISFPLATASCRVDEPSKVLVVSSSPRLSSTVNYGQINVEVTDVNLRHPGLAGSSQIQLSGITVQFVDSLNSQISAGSLVDRIRIMRQQTIVAELTSFDLTTNPVSVLLSSPLTLSAGQQDSIIVKVWVQSLSNYSGFGMLITDSTSFVIRDLSSGALLKAATDTLILASGSAFPMTSGFAVLKQPSSQPDICVNSLLPSSIVGGRDSLDLINIDVSYPSGGEFSPVTISEALVTVLDGVGKPVDPTALFDRIGMRRQNGTISYQPFVDLRGGKVVFNLDTNGIGFAPGDSAAFTLVGDFESALEIKNFVLSMEADDAFTLFDATDTSHMPGFTQAVTCATVFPFVTSTTDILLPAGRPTIEPELAPVQVVYAGQSQVTLFRAALDYESAVPLGDLSIEGLKCLFLKRTTYGLEPINASSVFDTVRLKMDGLTVATDSILSDDTVRLVPTAMQVLSLGNVMSLELACDIKADAPAANYVVRLSDSTFLDVSDKNLFTKLYPSLIGASFPLAVAELSLTGAGLEESFSNYPNPFVPSRGDETIISFVLVSDAYVDLELYTITGQLVKQVAINSLRSAGAYDTDKWDGSNGSGLGVVPGTYFCRITARYVNGKTESFRRKVAVLR